MKGRQGGVPSTRRRRVLPKFVIHVLPCTTKLCQNTRSTNNHAPSDLPKYSIHQVPRAIGQCVICAPAAVLGCGNRFSGSQLRNRTLSARGRQVLLRRPPSIASGPCSCYLFRAANTRKGLPTTHGGTALAAVGAGSADPWVMRPDPAHCEGILQNEQETVSVLFN